MYDHHRIAVLVLQQLQPIDIVKLRHWWRRAPRIVGVNLLEKRLAGGKPAVLEDDAPETPFLQCGELILSVEERGVGRRQFSDNAPRALQPRRPPLRPAPDASERA